LDEQKSDRISQPDQSIGDVDHRTGTRRHGEVIENAILQAAFDELNEVGYAHLTMEGVAARARTNKASVYRRWPNKSKLVVAALSKYLPRPANDVPDTGDLRNDLLILLRSIAQPLQTIGAETIHGLMIEHLGKDLISSFPQIRHPETEGKWATAMMTILKNAELRGEVKLEKISPRVISLPADLLRYELLTTHEPVSDATITEIVDDIFMPLVRV
jgi:AcrR family transcriptional regulator